jgi:hypothetical protein
VGNIVPSNSIVLIGDNGEWPSLQLGQTGTLSNSRCQLNAGASSAVLQNQTVTLNVALSFMPVFAGSRNAYMYAFDRSGKDTGWPQAGTYTVVPPFDFSLSTQAPSSIVAGRSTTAAITITSISGTGPVTFNWANQPLWPATRKQRDNGKYSRLQTHESSD